MTDTIEQQLAQLRNQNAAQQEELNELRQWIAGHSDGSEQIPHKFQMSERMVIGNSFQGTYPITTLADQNVWRYVRKDGLGGITALPDIEAQGYTAGDYFFEVIKVGDVSSIWDLVVAHDNQVGRHITWGHDGDEAYLHIEGQIFLAVVTPATISADQDNYDPTNNGYNTVFRLVASAAVSITGWFPEHDAIAPGHPDNGRWIMVFNAGTFPITFIAESTDSTAENRFGFANNLVLKPKTGATLFYDQTSDRWRLIGGSTPTRVTLPDIETYSRFLITAHYGDINPTDGYPEGTVEGILQAVRKGVNRVDVDVRRSADGTWYVMHDATVDRTTDGTGTVVSKTDAQMNALTIDGGYGYVAARHAGLYSPPTLEAVLDAIEPYNVTVQLDNKVAADADEIASYIVGREGWAQRAVINAYTQAEAQAIKGVDTYLEVTGGNGLNVAEVDIVEGEWDDYDETDVLAVAPKQFSVIIPITDYPSVDEAQATLDAYDNGAWNITVNDIEAALAARAIRLGGGAGAGGSSTGVHDEVLTDGAGNIIYADGDVVMVTGVPNP